MLLYRIPQIDLNRILTFILAPVLLPDLARYRAVLIQAVFVLLAVLVGPFRILVGSALYQIPPSFQVGNCLSSFGVQDDMQAGSERPKDMRQAPKPKLSTCTPYVNIPGRGPRKLATRFTSPYVWWSKDM